MLSSCSVADSLSIPGIQFLFGIPSEMLTDGENPASSYFNEGDPHREGMEYLES